MTQSGNCTCIVCVCMCTCVHIKCMYTWVSALKQTSKYLFSAVWSYSNCWHSPHLHTIWIRRYIATPYSHHLHCRSNRSLPRLTKLARPYLIVQNRSITLRCVPFHRQSVFHGRRDKSHSTHLIRYCTIKRKYNYMYVHSLIMIVVGATQSLLSITNHCTCKTIIII